MPRSPTGDYTLPLPPVITGTTIEASWANQTLADIQQAMTDSLSRSNQGNMQAHFLAVDGTQAAPGIAFLNEAGTGFYRPAAGDLYLAVLGVPYMRWTDDNGVQIFDGATWFEVVDEDQLATAISGLQSQITNNTSSLISSANFTDYQNLVLARAAGNFSVPINLQQKLKVNGQIKQQVADLGNGSGVEVVDIANYNRHRVTNSGAFTLQFTAPTASDGQLGTTYHVEGFVTVWNQAGAGVISLSVNGSNRVIGEQLQTTTSAQILSYFIDVISGVPYTTFVWSAS